MHRAYISYLTLNKYKYRLNINQTMNYDSAYITRFSSQPEVDESDTFEEIIAPRSSESSDLDTPEKTSSSNPRVPSVSSPLHKVDSSGSPGLNDSSKLDRISSYNPLEPSVSSPLHKVRSPSSPELGETCITEKTSPSNPLRTIVSSTLHTVGLSNSPELCDSCTPKKISSFNPPRSNVSNPVLKVDSSSSTGLTESITFEKIKFLTADAKTSYSSSTEICDSVTKYKMSSLCLAEPEDSSTEVEGSSSSQSEPDYSCTVVKLSSSHPTEPDDSCKVVKISPFNQSEPDGSCTVVKMISSSPTEPNDSCKVVKMSPSNQSEPDDSCTEVKMISYSQTKPDDLCTVVEMSSSNPGEPDDFVTEVKVSSCSQSNTDDCHSLVNTIENMCNKLTLSTISCVNQENKYREIIKNNMKLKKEKEQIILKLERKRSEYKNLLNDLENGSEIKEEIQPIQGKGLMYRDRFPECIKMGNKSKQKTKYTFMLLSELLTQIWDASDKLINESVSNILASDNNCCRSLGIDIINMYFPGEFNREPSDTHCLITIDGVLDKSTQSRKCANWYLHRACNLEILCDDIHYTWIYNSLKLTSYANLMDNVKENFENIYLRKLHLGEIDLEQSDRKYKVLEARKPRFERSRLCISEHNTPFCELCGWRSTWIKTFKKRGLYIKEAPDWLTNHIWYNEIKDESN